MIKLHAQFALNFVFIVYFEIVFGFIILNGYKVCVLTDPEASGCAKGRQLRL